MVVILFADYNKVAQHIMIYKTETCRKWDPDRSYDLMDHWDQYKQCIVEKLLHFKVRNAIQ